MADELKTVVRASADNPTGPPVGVAGAGTDGAVVVLAMPIWKMVLVRVTRGYLQVVVGLLTADGIGAVELAKGGTFWPHLLSAATIALAPAAFSLLQNALEFLTELDVKKPGLRA